MALRADGRIEAWGDDSYGQVSRKPAGSGFVAIDSFGDYSLALTASGTIFQWGDVTYFGNQPPPKGSGFTAIATGFSTHLALGAGGSIAAWGSDGNGIVSQRPLGSGFVAIDVGGNHALALRADGRVEAWGNDRNGQVSRKPTGPGFVAVAAGATHSLALHADGSIVAWGPVVPGPENYGQVTRTPTVGSFPAVAAGWYHSIGLGGLTYGVDASQKLDWPTLTALYHPQYLIAAAWGGKGTFPVRARDRLAAAPDGVEKAAYCLINFNNSSPLAPGRWQTGGWQVEQGIAAIGDQLSKVRFIAIDVEVDGQGVNSYPLPYDSFTRTQRVAEGVQAVLDAGLRPVIYAPRVHWDEITGGSTAFSGFPLWHASYAVNSGKTADQWDDRLDGFDAFGGWTTRAGRQYVDDLTAGNGVDLNVFDSSVFSDDYIRPPSAVAVPARWWSGSDPNPQVIVTGSALSFRVISRSPLVVRRQGTVTIRNIGDQAVAGPLQLVFSNLTSGYGLWNASGNRGGGPYLVLPVPVVPHPGSSASLLYPGEEVTSQVLFEGSNTNAVNYLPRIYSGYW